MMKDWICSQCGEWHSDHASAHKEMSETPMTEARIEEIVGDDPPWSESMNKHTKRRKRHRANAVIKFGKKAVRRHARISGRTGQIQSKRTPSSCAAYFVMLNEVDHP